MQFQSDDLLQKAKQIKMKLIMGKISPTPTSCECIENSFLQQAVQCLATFLCSLSSTIFIVSSQHYQKIQGHGERSRRKFILQVLTLFKVTQALLHSSAAASEHSIQLQAAAMGDHVLICV